MNSWGKQWLSFLKNFYKPLNLLDLFPTNSSIFSIKIIAQTFTINTSDEDNK